MKPNFEEGGKWAPFRSVFEGLETFLFVPSTTSKCGSHIHDCIDTKRVMSIVVISLLPALLFGIYNVGYQHYLVTGQEIEIGGVIAYGLACVLPKIVVSYLVGLGIEFIVAQWKHEEIQEGFLVTGMLIPMIVPANCPLWMLAVATAFAVIFAKEVFGGTGMNVFNVALIARAFLFFSYPQAMSGESVWIGTEPILGIGGEVSATVDGFTGATALGQLAVAGAGFGGVTDAVGNVLSAEDLFFGLIPGSIGETSKLAILIGAVILLWTGVASWKIMLSVFVGGALTAVVFNNFGAEDSVIMQLPWLDHILMGGFCFGAVFMATDPVTSSRTEYGKFIYGFLIGCVAIVVRCLNPGYPEGMMLAILLMNLFASLIDYFFVQANINRRMKRLNNV